MAAPTKTIPGAERRAHPRIAAPVRAFVVAQGGRFEVPVRELSSTGLFLFTPKPLAEIGDELALELQLGEEATAAAVTAEVARSVPAPQGEAGLLGMGLLFTKLTPDQQRQLDIVLARLRDGSGGGRRAYQRIAHRVDAWCTEAERRHGVLRDISVGGVGLWLEAPVPAGEHMTVEIERDGRDPMKLEGKVVTAAVPAAGAPFVSVGVQFDPMSDEQKKEVQDFLHALVRRG